MRTFAVLVVVALVSLLQPAATLAHDDDPRIDADRALAAPGEPLTVRGYEFPYEDVIAVALRAADQSLTTLGSVTADVEGSFTYTVVLPLDLPAGAYDVVAAGDHHAVDGPQLMVTGQPYVADAGDGQRQDDDGLLAPMPTFPPAAAAAAPPAAVRPTPASVPIVLGAGGVDHQTATMLPLLAALAIGAMIILLGTAWFRRRFRTVQPVSR